MGRGAAMTPIPQYFCNIANLKFVFEVALEKMSYVQLSLIHKLSTQITKLHTTLVLFYLLLLFVITK